MSNLNINDIDNYNLIIDDDDDDEIQFAESIGSPPILNPQIGTSNTQNIDTSTSTQLPPRPRKTTSGVWKYFDKIETIVEGIKARNAKCKICNKNFTARPTDGTSHLKRHYEKCRLTSQVDISQYYQLNQDSEGNLQNFTFDESRARNEVTNYIVRAEQPFTMVEKHDFSGMLQRGFVPQYKGFSANTCKRDIMKNFRSQLINLKSFFQNYEGKISLTSDMWTSKNHMGYMSLTAHYIDKDWMLNKRIISFKMLEYPHTGQVIGSAIIEEITNWGIEDKIFSITLDNATNNDVASTFLQNRLKFPLDGRIFRVRCCAHIINLMVQDGLKLLFSSTDKVKNIIRNINSSQSKYEIYRKCCKILKVKRKNINIDVPHRWNSTYELLDRAIKFKEVLNLYYDEISNSTRTCPIEKIEENDWLVCEIVRDFLHIFDQSTNILCGVYYPTSCLALQQMTNICATFTHFSQLAMFEPILETMRTKFDKYFDEIPLLFGIATVLHPMFKLEAVTAWLEIIFPDYIEKANYEKNNIEGALIELFDYYKNELGVIPTPSTVTPPLSYGSNFSTQNIALHVLKRRKEMSTSSSSGGSNELQRYLQTHVYDIDENEGNFDVLTWWRQHQKQYPVLSIMARDILTVPVSTVASEAAFSAGGRVISDKRCSLAPSTTEALICLKDWDLADSRKHDIDRTNELANQMAQLTISRAEWIADSSPEEDNS